MDFLGKMQYVLVPRFRRRTVTDSKQGGAFGVLVLIAVLFVMGAGGVLLFNMLKEHEEAPRPETPARYLKPADSDVNPPAKFSDDKVDEDKIIP
jgi:hypothetical protein